MSITTSSPELADDWECTSPDSPGIAPDAMFCEAQEPRQTPSQFRKLIQPSCSSDNDPISLRSREVAGESSGRCVIEVQEINISSTEMEKNCARVTYSELDSIPPGTVFSSRELENHRRSLSLENSVSASLVKPKELDNTTSKIVEKSKTKVGGSNPRQNAFETICNSFSLPNVDAEDTQGSSVESEPVTSFVERRTVFGTLKSSKSDEGDRIPFLSCGITSPEEHQNIKSDVAFSANSSDLEDDSRDQASCHLPTSIQYRKHCKTSAEENASCSTTKCDSAPEKQDPSSKNYVLLNMVTNNLKVGSPKVKNPASTPPTTESAPIPSSDNSQCIEEIFRVSESKLLKPKSEVKRPLNMYILFSKAMRPQVAAQYPNENPVKHIARVGALWRSLSDEERGVWAGRAEEEKQRHREQHPDYRYQAAHSRLRKRIYEHAKAYRKEMFKIRTTDS